MADVQSNLLPTLFFLIILGILTGFYAKRNGRNPYLWFMMGIGVGIFAPLILFFLLFQEKNKEETPTMTVSNPESSESISTGLSSSFISERSSDENKLWFYLDMDHQQMGPVSMVALRDLWNRGLLGLNSYVWSEGMENWLKIEALPSVQEALNRNKSS